LPAAYLIGMTFAAISMIMTATASTIGSINNFLTLFILPMFWVSGVFFPLDRLPEVVQNAAWALPLTAAAALVRGLFSGDITPWMLVWVAEMVAFLLLALWIASRQMRRRLIK
ncbi:MAG: ABC transporter permease, partial [Chloroflexi bacterium]|nr:ABC transporter permease [Chloroflexota bacterium]